MSETISKWIPARDNHNRKPGQFCLLIPVLNEIDGLNAVLPSIEKNLFDEIIMIDGGSDDGSVEFCQANGIRVIHQVQPGLSGAILDGINASTTEFIIEFSPDGNCRTEDIPALVSALGEGHDLVVVSRYLPPAKSEDDTFVTALGNWIFTFLINALGKSKITDSLTIFRGFRVAAICTPDFYRYLRGPVFEPLTTCWTQVNGLQYFEFPGNEPPRIGGEKKMRIFYNGLCILYMIFRFSLSTFTRHK